MGLLQDIIDLTDGNAEASKETSRTITDLNETQSFTNTMAYGGEDLESEEDEGAAQNVDIEESIKDDQLTAKFEKEPEEKPKGGNLKSDNGRKSGDKDIGKKEKTFKEALKEAVKEAVKTGEPQSFTTKEGKNFSIIPNEKGGLDIYDDENLQTPAISLEDNIENLGEGFMNGISNKLYGLAGLNPLKEENNIQSQKENKEQEGVFGSLSSLGKETLEELKKIVSAMDDRQLNEALSGILNPTKDSQNFDK